MITKAHISEYVILFDVWESSVKATHDFLTTEDFQKIMDAIIPDAFTMVDLYVYKSETGMIDGFIGILNKKVEMLFIKPEKMGMGIGTKLLDFAVLECNCNLVDVNEQNQDALNFYIKRGFNIIGRIDTDPMGLPYPIIKMEYSAMKQF